MLETVIYAAIFVVLVLAVVNSLLAIVKSYGAVRVSRAINISASAAMERMAREMRKATGTDAASVFGFSPGRLKLNTAGAGGAAVIEFFSDNGALAVKEDSGATEYLTASSTELTYLEFNKITSPAGTAVKIKMTVRAGGANMQRSENFYNTITLRGSY